MNRSLCQSRAGPLRCLSVSARDIHQWRVLPAAARVAGRVRTE
ncbi:hypothetical protein [Nocardia sp. NPDC056000]